MPTNLKAKRGRKDYCECKSKILKLVFIAYIKEAKIVNLYNIILANDVCKSLNNTILFFFFFPALGGNSFSHGYHLCTGLLMRKTPYLALLELGGHCRVSC
ncbi:uncharacterized protein BX663DRAFT_488124 [Cokeromyces recurvatus]|uniref:uncharacterized protein n=1 Tax=Cokeromyces recurvatus TaxID=90255 RepID=UPI0022203DD0|nr:uncharacterized protein BX663DRAFT_488124 [Cokeromyces recurvatus]KAI7900810.1 hypothetical protein BX663DRAFT_488124 [Cokeromyces recurvatus]